VKCKKCGSENLKIVKAGPHKKLVCADCGAYQKFLSKADAGAFKASRAEDFKEIFNEKVREIKQ